MHPLGEDVVLVKREDLCCPSGPPFSKMRGVVAHVAARPEGTIGVLDTRHSKAGWAVARACRALGKRCVTYWPRYKSDPPEGLVREPQIRAAALGSATHSLRAGRSAILFHAARKHLVSTYPDSYLMPNALKIPESVTENAAEASRTAPFLPDSGTLVVSISSGTVAAGVLRGLSTSGVFRRGPWDVVLHLGYSRSIEAAREYVLRSSEADLDPGQILLVDEGYGYSDAVDVEVPFPCNPYYDAKAWRWLSRTASRESLMKPLVFWNIGD
jgi:hypothetical protein